jgi:hypothetical protein
LQGPLVLPKGGGTESETLETLTVDIQSISNSIKARAKSGCVTDACIAGRPVRFGLLSHGIAISRDMLTISRE